MVDDTEQQSTGSDELALSEQSDGATGGDSAQGAETAQEQSYDVNGEKVPLSELTAGYMRQSDYTRKTQEAADERRRLEDLTRSYEKAQSLWSQTPAQVTPPTSQDQYLDPETARLNAELHGLRQTVTNQSQMVGQMRADMLLDKINNDPKYDGMFKDKTASELLLSKHLQMQRGDDIQRTADEIHSFITKMRVKESKATEEKIVKNLSSATRKAPTGAAQAGPKAPPKEFSVSKASWRDLDKVAADMF